MSRQQVYQNEPITRQDLFRNWRIFRSGMFALSNLEAQLVLEIKELSRVGVSVQEAEVQYWYLGNSLARIIHE